MIKLPAATELRGLRFYRATACTKNGHLVGYLVCGRNRDDALETARQHKIDFSTAMAIGVTPVSFKRAIGSWGRVDERSLELLVETVTERMKRPTSDTIGINQE